MFIYFGTNKGNLLRCQFQNIRSLGYSCVISGANLTSSNFVDTRSNLRPSGDVRAVVFKNSVLNFVPAQILFLTFINLTNLNINEGNKNLKLLRKSDFEGAEILTGLFLQNNEIKELTAYNFNNTQALKYLFLSNNSIYTIEDYAFEGLRKVLKLRLDFNKLESIRNKTFSGLINMKILNLEQNILKIIHFNAFNDIKVQELNFVGNICINMTFSDFRKDIDGNIVSGMCRYHEETELSKENALLNKKLKNLELKIRKNLIAMKNTESYCNEQKLECDKKIETIRQECSY